MKRVLLVAVLIITMILPGVALESAEASDDCNWFCWGGNNSRTQYINDDCDIDFSDFEIFWKREVESGFSTSPLVTDHSIYTTSNSGMVNRFDISSSSMIWRKDLEEEIMATPCTNESKIVIPTYSEDGKVFCLDNETGGIIWTKKLKGPISSSPIIIDDKVYIATELAVIACLNMDDGSMAWSRVAEEMIVTSPCQTDVGIVVTDSNSQAYCLDFETGIMIWSKRFNSQIATAPTYSDKFLYYSFDDGSIASISSSNGEFINWFKKYDDGFDSSVIATDSHIIASGTSGNIHCIRKNDGIRIWKKDLGVDGLSNSPIMIGRKIIVNNSKGKFFVLNLAKKGEIIYEKDFAGEFRSSPSIGFGKLFVNSYKGDIYCMSTKPMAGREPQPEPDPPFEGDEITMHGNNINLVWRRCNYKAVGTNGGNVFVEYQLSPDPQNGHANVFLNYLDKKTGKELWQKEAYIGLDLEDTYGYRYFSNNGKLFCIALGDHNTYATIWKYDVRTQHRDWMSRDQVHGYGAPVCAAHIREYDGGVYLGNCNGELFCLNSTDGNVRWKTKLDYTFNYPNFLGAYEGDHLYWVSTELNCTDKLTGQLLWRFDALAPNVSGNPTIWNNKLLVASRGYQIDIINCINRYTGEYLWSYDSKGFVDSLFRHDDVLIFEEYQENSEFVDIVAIDLNTKTEKWRIEKGKLNIRKGYKFKKLVGDTFYITGSKGEKNYVSALDPETGRTIWTFFIHEPATRLLIDDDKYYASIGGKVFYIQGENCLYCYSLSPKSAQDWILDPVPEPDPEPLPPTDPNPPSEQPEQEVFEDNDPCGWYMTRGYIKEDFQKENPKCEIDISNLEIYWKLENSFIPTQPVVANKMVYITSKISRLEKSILLAVDTETGKVKFNTDINGTELSDLALSNNAVYAGGNDGIFHSISRKDGSELWQFGYHYHPEFISAPFVSKNRVLFVSKYVSSMLEINRLHCIDPVTGNILWRKDEVNPEIQPVAQNGMVYTLDKNNRIICLSIYTGELMWTSPSNISFGQPIVSGELVFARAKGRRMYCFKAVSGKMKWHYRMEKNTTAPDDFLHFYNGQLIVLSDNQIFSLDANTGELIWKIRDKYDLGNGFVVKDNYVFLTKSSMLQIIDMHDEKPSAIETKLAANRIAIADNAIYTTVGKDLYCYKTFRNKPAPPPANDEDDEDDIVPDKPTIIGVKYQLGSNTYYVNGVSTQMDVTPQVISGRTLLPARYVTEPLGGKVSWDGTERKVVCTLGSKIIELWIGKPVAKIDGIEVQIDTNSADVVPTIIDGRTMVPMRFLAESFGCEVEWISETKEIILSYAKQ